jgi:hypothetical protein
VFSADGKAVYVNSGYYPALTLVKIDIRSLERSTVATSKYAVDIRIAPDDSIIAFTEFEQAYLTPFSGTTHRTHCTHARTRTHAHTHTTQIHCFDGVGVYKESKPLALSSRTGQQPKQLQRCSQDGTHYVTWVRRGGKWTLAWLLAHDLYLVNPHEVPHFPPPPLARRGPHSAHRGRRWSAAT